MSRQELFGRTIFCSPFTARQRRAEPGAGCALLFLADSVPRASNEHALAVHGPGHNGVWETDQAPAAQGDCAPVCLCPPAVRDRAGAGQVVVLETSTDLVNWTDLATNTVGASPLYFRDPAPPNSPCRFYRARAQ